MLQNVVVGAAVVVVINVVIVALLVAHYLAEGRASRSRTSKNPDTQTIVHSSSTDVRPAARAAAVVRVVLIDWNTELPAVNIRDLRATARQMAETIPCIDRLHEGTSVSPEGAEQGCDWAMVITFADAVARDHYVHHPDHVAVAQELTRAAQQMTVFDL